MKGQHVIRRNGYFVVLTRIGRQHRKPGQKWEIEVSRMHGNPRLRYRKTIIGAVRYILRATHKPASSNLAPTTKKGSTRA